MNVDLSGLVMALAAGVLALSCAGGSERQTVSGPAPVAAQPPTASDDGGLIGEAAKTPTVWHYDATTKAWKDLTVPASAVQGHLSHGDVTPSCATACRCFAPTDLVTPICTGGGTSVGFCSSPAFGILFGGRGRSRRGT